MARQTFYAESLTEQSTTSTTFVDACTLTETLDASSTYYSFFSVSAQNSSNLSDTLTTMLNSSDSVTYNTFLMRPAVASAYESFFSAGIQTTTSSVSKTFKTQYRASANTARVRDCRILLLKKETGDQEAETSTGSTSSSTTYVDVTGASLTFTPATAGDYIIIAVAEHLTDSSLYDGRCRIDVTGTQYNEQIIRRSASNNEVYTYASLIRLNLAASSQTIKLQHNISNTLGNVTTRNVRIIALRADMFNNNFYQRTATRTTTTVTSATNFHTTSPTLANTEHVYFSMFTIDRSNTTTQASGNFQAGATTVMNVETRVTNSNVRRSCMALDRETPSAGSLTFRNQYWGSSVASNTGMANAAISVIQTGDAPAPSPSSLPPGSLAMMGYGI